MCRVVIDFVYKTKRVPVPHTVTEHFASSRPHRYRLVQLTFFCRQKWHNQIFEFWRPRVAAEAGTSYFGGLRQTQLQNRVEDEAKSDVAPILEQLHCLVEFEVKSHVAPILEQCVRASAAE